MNLWRAGRRSTIRSERDASIRMSVAGRIFIALTVIFCLNGPRSCLAQTGFPGLDTLLAGTQRSAEHRARDQYRHPGETLDFFGLLPSMTVIEILPGADGWYTEILAPLLRAQGKLITVTQPRDPDQAYFRQTFDTFNAKLDAAPDVYDKVERRILGEALGSRDSADMVLAMRTTHNWIGNGELDARYKAILAVLKPGGILGIEQHRGADDGDPVITARSGYVSERFLIVHLESLGFRFMKKSEINANPRDTKDYPRGVWALPPGLALGAQDRAKYLAIGESDRMTLKFIKPGP